MQGIESPPEAARDKRSTDVPTRSQIAPVGETAPVPAEKGRDSPSPIAALLKALESKTASAALTNAAALEKLPAAQRIALKQALRAATEAHTEVETIKGELSRVKERLQLAEKDLLEKSQALRQHTAQAEEQVAGLTADLSAAVVTNRAFESRFHVRTVYLGFAYAIALSALITCAVLLLHSWRPPPLSAVPHETSEAAPLRAMPPARESEPQESVPEEPTEAAFERLDRALAGVPSPDVDRALNAANLWLKASGAPPCTVRFDGTKVSLLVTPAGKVDGPLAASLDRCAQAVEHVVE